MPGHRRPIPDEVLGDRNGQGSCAFLGAGDPDLPCDPVGDGEREIFQRCPQVKRQLWGGELWTDGYVASTVGKHGNERAIGTYVRAQGQEYTPLHVDYQLALL